MNSNKIDWLKPIVVYGAGGGGKKTVRILLDLKYTVTAFIDSNSDKWDNEIYGIKVYSPEWLKNHACNIIIASIKEPEIEEHLRMEGLADNIVLKEAYIMRFLLEHIDEIKETVGQPIVQNKPQLILSSETGFGCWGVEQYTRTVAEIFTEKDIPVTIFTKKGGCFEEERREKNIVEYEFDSADYFDLIKKEITDIIKRAPCVVQDNWQSYTLIAAIIAKRLFPEQVSVFSMVHNEFQRYRRIAELLEKDIDYISGVSWDIIEKITETGKINPQKLLYKESPIHILPEERFYELDDQKPLRLAYGGRITKEQKRTHLLIPLMERLIEKNINIRLEVVGNGSYCHDLLQESRSRNWGERYRFLGYLKYSEMSDFWKDHDIYLNLSDYEGTSLAMLEAMAAGCVPIVTKVSGTSEYIDNGVNGFLCNLDCVYEMADIIESLEKNRKVLPKLGENAQKRILDKCNREAFYEYWIKNISMFDKGLDH